MRPGPSAGGYRMRVSSVRSLTTTGNDTLTTSHVDDCPEYENPHSITPSHCVNSAFAQNESPAIGCPSQTAVIIFPFVTAANFAISPAATTTSLLGPLPRTREKPILAASEGIANKSAIVQNLFSPNDQVEAGRHLYPPVFINDDILPVNPDLLELTPRQAICVCPEPKHSAT